MRVVAMMFGVVIGLAGAVSAQVGNPANTESGARQDKPGMPSPHSTNPQDHLFARQATIGGLAEIDSGRLAERTAKDDAVKAFAAKMIGDHGRANDQLKGLAERSGIPLPDGLDQENTARRKALDGLTGDAFDLAYMRAQAQDHAKTVQLLAWEINSGQAAALKGFASETLPVILQHLRDAQNILARISGQAPQGIAPEIPGRSGNRNR